MPQIKTIEDYKMFVSENRDKFIDNIVDIADLPEDDEWIQDDIWDEIYEREVLKQNGTKSD